MMMNQSRFANFLMLLFLVAILQVQDTLAFSSVQVLTRMSTRTKTPTIAANMSILDEFNNDKDEKLPDSFNPLNYKSTKSNSAYSYSGTTISLRKTTMQGMTNALLNVASNSVESETILQEYSDFLLEPLDDLEAVLVRTESTRYVVCWPGEDFVFDTSGIIVVQGNRLFFCTSCHFAFSLISLVSLSSIYCILS